jgi:hypothetical protein
LLICDISEPRGFGEPLDAPVRRGLRIIEAPLIRPVGPWQRADVRWDAQERTELPRGQRILPKCTPCNKKGKVSISGKV